MRTVVLGCTGMLGHALTEHLRRFSRYDVVPISRNQFDASKDTIDKIPKCDFLVNCIGAIKQNCPSFDEMHSLNVRFPRMLAAESEIKGTKLIHVSTDCVFSGKRGGYIETDVPDPNDDYGTTKMDGEEPKKCMVIRTSLVGRELRGKRSLLEWFISQAGKNVKGYTNHLWNGLTTREFSKCVLKIIEEGMYSTGIHHVFSTTISKFEMLNAFNKRFELEARVAPTECETTIDRTLSTEKELNGALGVLPFQDMVREL